MEDNMDTERITYTELNKLVLEILKGNMITQTVMHFDSREEMMKWMHDHVDDGYYGMWATTVEVKDVYWIDKKRKVKG